jgi:hypothetical protein
MLGYNSTILEGMIMPEQEMQPNEDLNSYEIRLRSLHESGRITANDFFAGYARENAKLYMSRTDPRGQSGHGGDIYRWRHVRSMILEAIYADGTFIDIGCANGHLIESLNKWMQYTDVKVDFYGLELSRDLYNLALNRLPEYSSRLFHGNGLNWKPPFQFNYVYTMVLADIPGSLQKVFLSNLYDNCLCSGGRLILGPWNVCELENEVDRMGFSPTGYCEKTIVGNSSQIKRIVWIDKPR